MTKVLVTGASGFLGSMVMNRFATEGFDVTGWDISKKDNVEVVDLLDEDSVIDALMRVKPDIVIHCAGSADVNYSVMNPSSDFKGNVMLTHNLLFALHKLNMDYVRFVFLSSASVYGNPATLPITEDMPLRPMSPYAVHKSMCEELCMYFANNYGMSLKIARIFSAYGAGLKKQIFWDMHQKVLSTNRLEMFGTGLESRDYIHVKDVVNALYILATSDSEHIVFNVANGVEHTIAHVTEIFARASGLDSSVISYNGIVREGNPLNWRADISRIKALGYAPTVSIEDGISDYYNWVMKVNL